MEGGRVGLPSDACPVRRGVHMAGISDDLRG